MPHPNQQQVVDQIQKLEDFLNDWQMIPATADRRNRVLLGLLSKALTVARAICSLVDTGFPAEAFGLSRTLIEVFLYVRYMGNKETEERVDAFVDHVTRVQKEWVKLNSKYFPGRTLLLSASHDEAMKIAERFPTRYKWTPKGEDIRFMASEPDTFEFDAAGQPITNELDYDVLYFWTSLYVHVASHAILAHVPDRGDVFRVRPRIGEETDLERLALFNVLSYLTKAFIQGCRAMREDQPEAILQEMFAMMPKFERGSG